MLSVRNNNTKSLLSILIKWFLTVLTIAGISYFPKYVELIYAQNIYPIVAIVNRWAMHFFSFSVGDIIYFFGFSYLLFLFLKLLKHLKDPIEHLVKLSNYLLKIIWIFYLSWGFNYFREPLAKQLSLSQEKYSLEQLQEVTNQLIDKSNTLQLQLTQNDSIAVEIPYSRNRILSKVFEGYKAIESIIHKKYKIPCIKHSIFSKQISYMSVSGYLNPFSGEAQVNKIYPKIFIPSISSHEVAHQLGYAPEDEANFLGYLSASYHPDPYFRYSANIDALYYCLMELRKADKALFKADLKRINRGILKNYKQAGDFSSAHRFPIDFSSSYDAYLKLNKQKSGIKSYNEMVSLLIAYSLKE